MVPRIDAVEPGRRVLVSAMGAFGCEGLPSVPMDISPIMKCNVCVWGEGRDPNDVTVLLIEGPRRIQNEEDEITYKQAALVFLHMHGPELSLSGKGWAEFDGWKAFRYHEPPPTARFDSPPVCTTLWDKQAWLRWWCEYGKGGRTSDGVRMLFVDVRELSSHGMGVLK